MKKDISINPIGLKGNQINERMKELMGIQPINENKSTSVIELTKIGPDGKAYAIIRENHEYYIKTTSKTSDLTSQDFQYIGGLMNKKSEAYPSYAKAIKHLNLKFNSIAESLNKNNEINVFKNDNLVNEAGLGKTGFGFSGEGNLEGDKPLGETEEKTEDVVEEELTEVEQAVESMVVEEEPKKEEEKEPIKENSKLKISRALDTMDSIIEGLDAKTVKKKTYTIR